MIAVCPGFGDCDGGGLSGADGLVELAVVRSHGVVRAIVVSEGDGSARIDRNIVRIESKVADGHGIGLCRSLSRAFGITGRITRTAITAFDQKITGYGQHGHYHDNYYSFHLRTYLMITTTIAEKAIKQKLGFIFRSNNVFC